MRYVLLLLVLLLLSPSVVEAETIVGATFAYTIEEDGDVRVTEEIIYDFGTENRHGIFRTIDTTHAEPASVWYRERRVTLEVERVIRDGQLEPYSVSGNRSVEIKIGDADSTISGIHTYKIEYTLHGALSYFDTGAAELYWNVTGSDWKVMFDSVLWSIDGVDVGDAYCYITDRDCEILANADGYKTHVSTLNPGEELTIAVSIPSGVVQTVILEPLRIALFIIFLIPLFLILLVLGIFRYRRFYHKKRSIIAEYEPFRGIEPMFAGTLIDDAVDSRDIAAGIVYLAEQGFITIRHTKRKVMWLFNVSDYEVSIKKCVTELPSQFLQTVLGLLFTDVSVGKMVALSELRRDTKKKTDNMKTLRLLQSSLRDDLVRNGYFETRSLSWLFYTTTIIFVGLLAASALLQKWLGGLAYGLVFIMTLCFIVYSLATMRRRTALGYEAQYHLKGFREFLSVTDKERFAFHDAPERSPEQFMQYLPYAIAFGVEEKWAELFSDMEITTPGWYDGQGTAFAATAFAHDISAFSSSVTSSTSASSGGGSAGGGGGGGGGGSW